MKRIFAIILSTVLLLGALVACGTTPAETTPTPTTPTPTTPLVTTPVPTAPVVTPAPTTPAPTTPVVTTPVVTGPVLVPDFSSCRVSPRFSFLADLDTYMTTGSTDVADYLQAPTRLDLMPTLEEISADGGHLSFGNLFGIGDDRVSCSEILIYRGDPFGMRIDYHFDHVSISIAHTRAASMSQQMNSGSEAPIDIVSVQDLSAPLPIENGYVSYITSGIEVIYQIKDGVKIDVRFVYDGFCVIVRAARWYSDDVAAELLIFMQHSAFSNIHPLFANDNQQVSAAVATMKTAIESRAAVGK